MLIEKVAKELVEVSSGLLGGLSIGALAKVVPVTESSMTAAIKSVRILFFTKISPSIYYTNITHMNGQSGQTFIFFQ